MASDETLNKMIYELQVLRGVSENMQQRIAYVSSAVAELQTAGATLEGLEAESEDELLVPIGGGSYVRCKVIDREKLVMGIGSDVAVEKKVADAKNEINSRITELNKALQGLQSQLEEATQRGDILERQLRTITQQQAAGTGADQGAGMGGGLGEE